ncbi:DUF4350 domain-containing protein, partial [Actinocorallia lasiicapitis]
MTVQSSESASQVVGRRFRKWRLLVFALLAMMLVALVLAALRPPKTSGYLDPDSVTDDGTRALVEIMKQRGTAVEVARSLGRAGSGGTLVVAHTERLSSDDLARLGALGTSTDLVLLEPARRTLDTLAPGVVRAGSSYGSAAPGCALAEAAGEVDFGSSALYTTSGEAQVCFAEEGASEGRVVQLKNAAGRTVTVVGSATPFTNEHLDDEGNAAFALNLISAADGVTWLMPPLPSGDGTGDQSLGDLVPDGARLFLWQVAIAVVLMALWRARRLGPVVAEKLPVAVRSAETVEGRSRLYRARRARDRAALALR